MKDKVKLGADASVAGGPVGRTATAGTDVLLKAEVLAYSRSRGAFAGVALDGTVITTDKGAIKAVYKRPLSLVDILNGQGVSVPPAATGFVNVLRKHSPRRAC